MGQTRPDSAHGDQPLSILAKMFMQSQSTGDPLLLVTQQFGHGGDAQAVIPDQRGDDPSFIQRGDGATGSVGLQKAFLVLQDWPVGFDDHRNPGPASQGPPLQSFESVEDLQRTVLDQSDPEGEIGQIDDPTG